LLTRRLGDDALSYFTERLAAGMEASLITADRDFGELVTRRGMLNKGDCPTFR